MKKKLSLILCLCFMVLGLAACGEDPKSVDYFGMTYDDIQSMMEQEVATLVSFTDENRAYIQAYGSETAIKLVETWDESTSDLGAYQGLGEFTITKTQDTVTADQVLEFPGREVVISHVYTYNYETKQAELTDASVDKVYTFGEKMEKAGLNTLMGMGTVFTVLILISLIIYCFRFIAVLQDKISGKGKKAKTKAEEASAAAVAAELAAEGQQTAPMDDLELVAVISAAVAAASGTSADGFVVRSIRRR